MTFGDPAQARPFLMTALITQIGSGLLAGIATDGGALLRIWCTAMVSYWALGCVLLAFSIHTRKPVVRSLLRWAFLVLLITVAPLLSLLLWGPPNPGVR